MKVDEHLKGRTMGDHGSDGTDKLCRALYAREATPADYLGGSEAKMLHDAAAVITRLREEVKLARKDHRRSCRQRDRERDVLSSALEEAREALFDIREDNCGCCDTAARAKTVLGDHWIDDPIDEWIAHLSRKGSIPISEEDDKTVRQMINARKGERASFANLAKFQGETLDAYDMLPTDVKQLVDDYPLGVILEGRLQEIEQTPDTPPPCQTCGGERERKGKEMTDEKCGGPGYFQVDGSHKLVACPGCPDCDKPDYSEKVREEEDCNGTKGGE